MKDKNYEFPCQSLHTNRQTNVQDDKSLDESSKTRARSNSLGMNRHLNFAKFHKPS